MVFTASAPGKIILFGEHAVVYGVPAIATSVALRTYVTVDRGDAPVELRLPDLDLDVDISAEDLAAMPLYTPPAGDVPSTLDGAVHSGARALADKLLPGAGALRTASVLAFLYLYATIYRPVSQAPVRFTVRSALPLGAGLGSSASLSVALAAALLRASGTVTADTPAADVVHLATAHSFLGECCIHGNPSGIDNLVAARGGAVYYQRRADGAAPLVRSYARVPEIRLLLTDTAVSRSTAELVARVRGVRERWPALFDALLAAFTQLVRDADALLAAADDPQLVEKLAELAELNHGFLGTLAVSHPSLERVVAASKAANVGRTKLTGAGGGGCAITLLNDSATEAQCAAFRDLLGPEYRVFSTGVGGPGVAFAESTAGSVEELQKLAWTYFEV